MELVLKKGPNPTTNEPLLVMYETEGKKVVKKVRVNEIVTFNDQLAYDIMSKYPTFFEPVTKAQEVKKPDEYKTKVMKAE